LPELTAQHLRYVGPADSEQIGSFDLFQATIFHNRVDLGYKLRLDQMLLGIRHTEILEHIAAASLVFPLVAHGFFFGRPLSCQHNARRAGCLEEYTKI
jgi:hypothetical protein